MWHLVDTAQLMGQAATTVEYAPVRGWTTRSLRGRWSAAPVPGRDWSAAERSVAPVIARELADVLRRHRIIVDPQVSVDSIVWCSDASEVQVRDVPIPEIGTECTDVWAHVDPAGRRFALSVDHQDLAEHRAGRVAHPEPIDLSLTGELTDALGLVAPWLGDLCDRVLADR